MEAVVENCVKEIADASIEVKSISDCIDDCEYVAAKKLLKRHQKSIEETSKRVKKTFMDMSQTLKNQRLAIAGLKQEVFKMEMAEMSRKNPEKSAKTSTEDFDPTEDDELVAAAKAAEENNEAESQDEKNAKKDFQENLRMPHDDDVMTAEEQEKAENRSGD